MTFEEILDQAIAMLQRRGRVTYGTLQLQFQLEAEHLAVLKEALLFGHPQIMEEEGRGLVWIGDAPTVSPPTSASPQPLEQPVTLAPRGGPMTVLPFASQPPDAERRQLSVLFCDIVDSTMLASQLDPEELREVVRAYQEACAKVIARFEGHIAQYLGDGLLVYFGYPLAHEDDAQRAVRAGLGIVEALGQLHTHLGQERGVHLAVRLGIHTGLVVVGDVGGGTRQEQLALGETPNLAARLQGIAAPNTLVISATTFQLLGGFFACQPLGTPPLKGQAQPLAVYRVLYESMARSRLEAAGSTGWTPLVGREQESGLLLERWAQVKDGLGQVVLLSGEAGIGKSRLVQVLKEQVAIEPQTWLTPCQCSPYHRHTPLYPMIDLLERVTLRFDREESPQQKLSKLEGFLVQYGLPLVEAVPLLAALLSLPLTAGYSPLTVSPEQQKQQTFQALLTILLRIATQQPVLFVMEDLHWVDPSTLELLNLLVDQGPTARILALFTFRPDFSPPWAGRAHLTQLTVNRLPRRQAAEVIHQVAHGKALPAEVVEQIVAKTDGVPLFMEELTKMVLESGLLQEWEERYELTGPLPPLAIPATLHDSLMARLDRLATVKGLAQLGATLGREFSYALLQAVSPWDEATLRPGLQQLVEAEFLYQQGLPPQATYRFKHALIQDAAYQSLLRSIRQQYHQRIAHVLEAQFPETVETQPELLAQHYTEAGLHEPALRYWQQAGRRASTRSAYVEAIVHLTQGLALLKNLPESPERLRHELVLQTILGPALSAARGYGAPEVEAVYTRAYELGQHVGEIPERLPVLWGLWYFTLGRADFGRAQTLGEQLLILGQRAQDPLLQLPGHTAMGITRLFLGEVAPAHLHLAQSVSLYNLQQHQSLAFLYGMDCGMLGRALLGIQRLVHGYPNQGLQHGTEALRLAQEVTHPYTLASILMDVALIHWWRREIQPTQAQAAALIALATEQGFTLRAAHGALVHGWTQVMQGEADSGLAQMRQALLAIRATGAAVTRSLFLGMFADACGYTGQIEAGLHALDEALAHVATTGELVWEAELHRLRGELLCRHMPRQEETAETCYQQALTVSQAQGARWLELRAAMSLSRLWQRQGKRDQARELLAPIYGWFTEGFETADLQEAKALLDALV